ncbi:MAG: hypothetical protein A4E74_00128 [Syntrophus sp. PtaB.Bin075]|nr:MAG: hypothetical protein A4E74_00128 [Syntrophus sp. PtaB.Bin075]
MNVEEVRETLGDYLIRERESRNITTEDLARATHLSVHFIEALEHNDFSRFSQKESIPGFLKLYARHLPLNYEGVLKRYQLENERILKQLVQKELPLSRDYGSPVTQARGSRWPAGQLGRWIIPSACAVMAVAISLSIYLAPEKAQPPVVPSSAKFYSTAQDLQKPQPAPIQPNPVVADYPASSTPLPEKPAVPASAEPLTPLEKPPAPATVSETEKVVVVGNRDSKRYHLPGMKYYNEVKAYHRVLFDSEEEALKAGYYRARE